MTPTRRTAALLLALSLTGCSTTTQPPEDVPGLASPDPATCATVREADHVYISSVDSHDIHSDFGVSVSPSPRQTYRQFRLPPGTHTLVIAYHQDGNPHSLALAAGTAGLRSPDRPLVVTLQPRHTYAFVANASTLYLLLGGLSTSKWHPVLTDTATYAPANTIPTTLP